MKKFLLLAGLLAIPSLSAKDYVIFSIGQDITTDDSHTPGKKNYYVNLGGQQGLKEGTVLTVYRSISRLDPYEGKNRYNFDVRIGKLKVLHAENNAAIARKDEIFSGNDFPATDINDFMIGDKVKVDIGKK